MNEPMKSITQLEEAILRLKQANAEYKNFVRTTRSQELACEGARDAVLAIARAELALKNMR